MQTVAALCRELIADRRSDGELLGAFISHRAEDAFTELILRHGPLVWNACRRLLPEAADAEDAFQAAFLVLVRRARRMTDSVALGPWLHRVAVWTARNVRRKNARRLARQTTLTDFPHTAPDVDLQADLDAALLELPTHYRDSIVLCHLQGFTRREAAERLGCPEGTLSGWLKRGLAKLRERLRGLDPTLPLAVTVAVPAALVANTARAATASIIAGGVVPPAVSSLVEGVLHMFWVKKATAASVALCAVFTLGVGIGLGTRTEFVAATASEGQEKLAPDPKAKAPAPPAAGEFDKEIAELEAKIRVAEVYAKAADADLRVAEAKYRPLLESPNPKGQVSGLNALANAQADAKAAAAELESLKKKLAALKAATAKAEEKPAPIAKAEKLPGETAVEKELWKLQTEYDEANYMATFLKASYEQYLNAGKDPKELQHILADM